jgi:hypothetical protein
VSLLPNRGAVLRHGSTRSREPHELRRGGDMFSSHINVYKSVLECQVIPLQTGAVVSCSVRMIGRLKGDLTQLTLDSYATDTHDTNAISVGL